MTAIQDRPIVYLISDGSMTNDNYTGKSGEFLKLVEAATLARISLIQIREKDISAFRLYELAAAVIKLTRNSLTKVLVNDRVDVAISAGADGVHLSSRSIPAQIVRRYVPKDFLIGVSTHTNDEIEAAKSAKADLVVFGPVFGAPGKGAPVGLDSLRSASKTNPGFPVLALGGVDESNYRDVLTSGAAGFAAIRFLNNAENLAKLSTELGL